MQYKHAYENALAKDDVPDFQDRIPPEVALELCVAHYIVTASLLVYLTP